MTQLATRDEFPADAFGGFEGSAAGDGALATREAGALSAVAREEAELKAAVVVAKRFPRDEAAAYARIMKSCQRPNFAECSMYRFPRGGQQIEGPSVDLAREMARCWGNIRYGLRVVTVDEDTVHIKGYALDLETNNFAEAEDKFEKLIQRKNRRTGTTDWVKPDERDLRELINRRGAILVRNALLQVLPPDVCDEAQSKAKETMRKAADGEIKQNPQDAIRRLVMAFDGIGVNAAMLSGYLKHDLSLINEQELANLRGVYKSIVDGNSRREEYFEIGGQQAAPSEKTADLNQKLRQETPVARTPQDAERIIQEKAAQARQKQAERPAPEKIDTATGEVTDDPQLSDAAESAAGQQQADDAAAIVLDELIEQGPEVIKKSLREKYQEFSGRISKADFEGGVFKYAVRWGGEGLIPADGWKALYHAVCEKRFDVRKGAIVAEQS